MLESIQIYKTGKIDYGRRKKESELNRYLVYTIDMNPIQIAAGFYSIRETDKENVLEFYVEKTDKNDLEDAVAAFRDWRYVVKLR